MARLTSAYFFDLPSRDGAAGGPAKRHIHMDKLVQLDMLQLTRDHGHGTDMWLEQAKSRMQLLKHGDAVIDTDLMIRLEDTAAQRIADADTLLREAEAARQLAAQEEKGRKREMAKGRRTSGMLSAPASRRGSQTGQASSLSVKDLRGPGKGNQPKPSKDARRGSNSSTASSNAGRKGGWQQSNPGKGGRGKSPVKMHDSQRIAGAVVSAGTTLERSAAGDTMLIKLSVPDGPRSSTRVPGTVETRLGMSRKSKGVFPVRVPVLRQRGEKDHTSSGIQKTARRTVRNPIVSQTSITIEDGDTVSPLTKVKSTARRTQNPGNDGGGSDASGAASEEQHITARRRQSLSSSSFGGGSDGFGFDTPTPDEDRAEGMASHRKHMRRILSRERSFNHDRASDSPAPASPKDWQTAPHLKQQVSSDIANCLMKLDMALVSVSGHNSIQTVTARSPQSRLDSTVGTPGNRSANSDGRGATKLALGGSQLSWYTRFNSAWPKCTAQPCVACAFTSGIYGFGSCDKVASDAGRPADWGNSIAESMDVTEHIELVNRARQLSQKVSKIAADPGGATSQKIKAIMWTYPEGVELGETREKDRTAVLAATRKEALAAEHTKGGPKAAPVLLHLLGDDADGDANDNFPPANERGHPTTIKSSRDGDGKPFQTATKRKTPAARAKGENSLGGGGGGTDNTTDSGDAVAHGGAAAASVGTREHHRMDISEMSIDYHDLTVTAAACDAETLQDNIVAHHCITIRKAVALERIAEAATAARAKQDRKSQKRGNVTGSPIGGPGVEPSALASPKSVTKGKGGSPAKPALLELAPGDEAEHDSSDMTLPRLDDWTGIPFGADGKPAPQSTVLTGSPLKDPNQVTVDPSSVSLVSELNQYSVQHEHLTPAWTIAPKDYFHNRHPSRQTEIDWACGQSLIKCCAKNHGNATAVTMPSECYSEDYRIGSTAVEFCRLSDGSGTLRWPSGRLALCVSNTPLGKYSWAFDDTDEKRMLLSFSPVGHGLVFRSTGGSCATQIQLTLAGGCAWKEDGQKDYEWDWASTPRLLPVQLCPGMTLHVTSRSNVVLEYSRSGRTFDLNLATSRIVGKLPIASAQKSKVLQTARGAIADVVKRANAALIQMHEKLLELASVDNLADTNWDRDSRAGGSAASCRISTDALPAVRSGRPNTAGYDGSDTPRNFLKRVKLDRITLPWEMSVHAAPPARSRSTSPRKGVTRRRQTESLKDASPEKMVSWRRQGLPTVPGELYDAFISKASASRIVVVATLDASPELQLARSALLRIHLRRLRGHNPASGVPPGVPLGADEFWLLGSETGGADDLLVQRHNIDAGALLFYGNGRLVHMTMVKTPTAFGVAELERCVEEARNRIGKIEYPHNFQFKPSIT